MTTADFSVTGSTSGAFASTAQADVVAGETLTFQLEATPALDVRTTLFETVRVAPESATGLVLSGSGVPATPGGTVTSPVVDDFAAFLVRCTINGGTNGDGSLNPDYVRERIIVVRKSGLRPIIPGERTQYDSDGYAPELNLLMAGAAVIGQRVEAVGQSAGGGTVDLALTSDLEDGESALIQAVIYGEDTSGDRALFGRIFAVSRSGGSVSAFAGAGIAQTFTAREDGTWTGPSVIVDVGGQGGIRLSGDGANDTDWTVVASVFKR